MDYLHIVFIRLIYEPIFSLRIKCTFEVTHVEYSSHVVGNSEAKIDDKKV